MKIICLHYEFFKVFVFYSLECPQYLALSLLFLENMKKEGEGINFPLGLLHASHSNTPSAKLPPWTHMLTLS
jgi:hypothetical protein